MVWKIIIENGSVIEDLKIAVKSGQIEKVYKLLVSLKPNPLKKNNSIELLKYIGMKWESGIEIIFTKLVENYSDYELDKQLAFNISVGNKEIVNFLLTNNIS